MVTKEQVYEALHECFDPEIPVNIVDLGLVYDVDVKDEQVAVKMTLTRSSCSSSLRARSSLTRRWVFSSISCRVFSLHVIAPRSA